MNADAVAQFDQYLYLFAIYYSHRKNLEKTKRWILKKLERNWNTKLTLPGLRKEIRPIYEKIRKELT